MLQAAYISQIYGKDQEETDFVVQKVREKNRTVDTSDLYEEEFFTKTIELVQEELKEVEEENNLNDIKFVVGMAIRDRMLSLVEITTEHGVVLTPTGIQLFSMLLPDYSREVEEYNQQEMEEKPIIYQ